MMRRILPIILLLLLPAFTIEQMGTVQISYFRITEEGNNIIISWQAREESDVKEYELYRMTRLTNNQFVKIQGIDPHGVDKAYIYRDDQVFKSSSELVDYRLEVVYLDGVREQLARDQVNYTSTAIRRTWGSIKAMFQ